jgi:hypothetical protein
MTTIGRIAIVSLAFLAGIGCGVYLHRPSPVQPQGGEVQIEKVYEGVNATVGGASVIGFWCKLDQCYVAVRQ